MEVAAQKVQVILLIDLGRYITLFWNIEEKYCVQQKNNFIFFSLKGEYHYPSNPIP